MTAKKILLISIVVGLVLRLWNINFGLPHSFYADEPEIGELAIRYTYEFRDIIRNNDIYKLVPENYVYGTFPVYIYTVLVMLASKTLNILNIGFAKTELYVFMRVINALVSLAIVPMIYLLLKRLSFIHKKLCVIVGLFLVVFNWKFIVHAHYLNHDIIITALILVANYFFLRYLQHRHATNIKESDTLSTVLFSIFFGLAVSTKVTVLLTFPLYLGYFLWNRDIRNLFGSVFIVIGCFVVTNPFAWIFISDFAGRILEMRIKEAGLVFDSADYTVTKYLSALSWMTTLPVLLLSLMGIIDLFRRDKKTDSAGKPFYQFYLLTFLQIIFYLVFFTIQSRRVDRWLLPIIPNVFIFALLGLDSSAEKFRNLLVKRPSGLLVAFIVFFGIAAYYVRFPLVLLKQFQRNTPKSQAYIWAKDNLPETSTKFGLTEEGLDPLNKLPLSTIWQYNAYEAKGGQFVYPPNPDLFDYIILSSRPVSWTKSQVVVDKYPYYASKWAVFFDLINNRRNFELIKVFDTAQPNLVPLSSVRIYKNINRGLLE